MTPFARLLLRLRRRAVHCYELLLYGLLLALAGGVVLASSPAGAEDVQCGNSHSSTAVMSR
jgi:hypothetical protein